jgi:hypothetical protein
MVNNANTVSNGSCRVAKNNKTFPDLQQFLNLTKKYKTYVLPEIQVKNFSTRKQQLLKMIS